MVDKKFFKKQRQHHQQQQQKHKNGLSTLVYKSFDGSPSLDFLQQKFSCLQRKEHFRSKQLDFFFCGETFPMKSRLDMKSRVEIATSLECLYTHVA